MANKPFNIDELYRRGFQNWEAPYGQAEIEQSWEKVQQNQGSASGGSESATGTGSTGSTASSGIFKGALTGLEGWLIGVGAALIVGSGAFYLINENTNKDQAQEKQENTKADTDQKAPVKPHEENDEAANKNEGSNQNDKIKQKEDGSHISGNKNNTKRHLGGDKTSQSSTNDQSKGSSSSGDSYQEKSEIHYQQKNEGKGGANDNAANSEENNNNEKALPNLVVGDSENNANAKPTVLLSSKITCKNQAIKIKVNGFEAFHRATYTTDKHRFKSVKNETQISWDRPGKYEVSFKLMNEKTGDSKVVAKDIRVRETPDVDFVYSNTGYEVTFKNVTKGAEKYRWFFGDGETSINKQPTHTFNRKGEKRVYLVATSKFGCKDTMIKQAYIEGRPKVKIPDIFTPNGDGKNDKFVIQNLTKVDHYHLLIRNSKGNKVFEANEPGYYWNGLLNNKGPECESGRYQFFLKYRYPEQEKVKEKTGTVLLKRE